MTTCWHDFPHCICEKCGESHDPNYVKGWNDAMSLARPLVSQLVEVVTMSLARQTHTQWCNFLLIPNLGDCACGVNEIARKAQAALAAAKEAIGETP